MNITAEVRNEDYLAWALRNLDRGPLFDAVVGNPPFIRYQYLPDELQTEAAELFSRLNLGFTRHTNAWVPFVLSALHLLKPGGRLGMVLPSEILHVIYAQSLRTYIGDECSYAMIFDPEDIWFKDTLQGAVVLLLEKKPGKHDPFSGVGIVKTKGRDFQLKPASSYYNEVTFMSGGATLGKWTYALLSGQEYLLLEKLKNDPRIHRFDQIASVDVGIVTGANGFFLVSDEIVEKYELEPFRVPMFGRSDHCPGVIYDADQHKVNSSKSLPNNFLYFDIEDEHSAQRTAEGVSRYGRTDETAGEI